MPEIHPVLQEALKTSHRNRKPPPAAAAAKTKTTKKTRRKRHPLPHASRAFLHQKDDHTGSTRRGRRATFATSPQFQIDPCLAAAFVAALCIYMVVSHPEFWKLLLGTFFGMEFEDAQYVEL